MATKKPFNPFLEADKKRQEEEDAMRRRMEERIRKREEERRLKEQGIDVGTTPLEDTSNTQNMEEERRKQEERRLRLEAEAKKRVEEEALRKEQELREAREREAQKIAEARSQSASTGGGFNPFKEADRKRQEEEEAERRRMAERIRRKASGDFSEGDRESEEQERREREEQERREREEKEKRESERREREESERREREERERREQEREREERERKETVERERRETEEQERSEREAKIAREREALEEEGRRLAEEERKQLEALEEKKRRLEEQEREEEESLRKAEEELQARRREVEEDLRRAEQERRRQESEEEEKLKKEEEELKAMEAELEAQRKEEEQRKKLEQEERELAEMEAELKRMEEQSKKQAQVEPSPAAAPPVDPKARELEQMAAERERRKAAEVAAQRAEAAAQEQERLKRQADLAKAKEVSAQKKAFNPFLSMDKKKQEEEEAMRRKYMERLKQREEGGGSNYEADRERRRQEEQEEQRKREERAREEEERKRRLREFDEQQEKLRHESQTRSAPTVHRNTLAVASPSIDSGRVDPAGLLSPGVPSRTTDMSPAAAAARPKSASVIVRRSAVDPCEVCGKTVYFADKVSVEKKLFHKGCFRCAHCNGTLKLGTYASLEGKYYCKPHFKQLFKLKGNYASGFGGLTPIEQWVQANPDAAVASGVSPSPSPQISRAESGPSPEETSSAASTLSVKDELELLRSRKASESAPSNTSEEPSFGAEEKAFFVEAIDNALRNDSSVAQFLPLAGRSFEYALSDGILLCKFINANVPETLDDRVINYKINSPVDKQENWNLCINSGKAIGCRLSSVSIDDLMAGKSEPLLKVTWEIIKAGYANKLQKSSKCSQLAQEDEQPSDVASLPPEQIVLRWFNLTLKNAYQDTRVYNFTSDFKDGKAYIRVMSALAPSECDDSALSIQDQRAKAASIVETAGRVFNIPKFLSPDAIVEGHPRLNYAFATQLFLSQN